MTSSSFPKPPFYIRLAQSIVALTGGKGEHFLRKVYNKLGLLSGYGRYPFFDGYMYVPFHNPHSLGERNHTFLQGLRDINFINALYQNLDDFILIDCGAAYGMISMRLAKLCPKLKKVIAIDPNEQHCEILNKNLGLTDKEFEVVYGGVSNFTGKAEIVFPNGPADPYSAYIEPRETGSISIVQIDDLITENTMDLALKIDVEGEEISVLEGGAAAIAKAPNVGLFIEIHPEPLARKGNQAQDILKAASKIRKFKWVLAELPTHEISEDLPFFEQVDEIRQYDIIGISQ